MAATKEYTTDRIRNVVVVGHGGSGKTTLIDALAFATGTTPRHGSTEDGTALTQYRAEEKSHAMSMYCTPAYAEYLDTKINLIDTPGYMDFFGDVEAALRVADGAIVVVGAKTGVEVGTREVWRRLRERNIPCILFVSKMDREGASFTAAYEGIKADLVDNVVPVEIPVGDGDDFHGVINLFSGKTRLYEPGREGGDAYRESEVPEEYRARYEEWHTELLENVATTDETLLEHYLEGVITREEALAALKKSMAKGEMVPLFCGSATKAYGMRQLLQKVVELLPSPAEAAPQVATDPETGAAVELTASDDGPLAALVFKTSVEQHVGELSFFRVFSGTVENGTEVLNADRGSNEKIAHLAIPLGRTRNEVPRLHAGDIGVVTKLRDTHTNNTLSGTRRPLRLEPIVFPTPQTRLALKGATRNDEDKMGQALHKLHEEDPTFHAAYDGELRQTIARGLGELHLEVQLEKLRERYNVDVTTAPPRIAYRETLRKEARAQGRYKKQTGGKGQFGDCHLHVYPLPRGGGYEFKDSIVGGVIPGKFVPAVDKGIQEAAERGVLAGYPVIDFGVECYDGSYHSVDSSEMAFKIAGSMGFQKAVKEAGAVLLEPIMNVDITIPNEALGDVTGDISHRRGRILGMDTQDQRTVIRAQIPEAELFGYASRLRSLTQGRGHHTRAFSGYEEAPPLVRDKVVAESQQAEE